MSTRLQQAQLIQDANFLNQVAGSLVSAASNVVNEASSTANHNRRVSYAEGIFANPLAQARIIAPGLLSNATIAGDAGGAIGASGTPVSDSDLDYVIASLFDIYSSYYVAIVNSQGGAPSPAFGS